MPTPKDIIQECNDISQALADWFISQDIDTAKAALVMSYLIGIMAATDEPDMNVVQSKLKSVQTVMNVMAAYAYTKPL